MNMCYRRNLLLFLILIVSSTHVTLAQYKFGDAAKIEESNVKQGGSSLPAISSRFLDLGGVISQLFSGFNQGSAGGRGPSLNLPTNSQFYTGVPAQISNAQIPAGFGNDWLMPRKGNKQNSAIQHQQWNQLNVPNPSYSFKNQGSQLPGRLTNAPWSRNQGNNSNKGRGQADTNNEGTLDDFFPKDRNQTGNLTGEREETNEEPNEKNAIWGKQVIVPTTTHSENIVFRDNSETPSQKQCVQNCPTTSEYVPVCGTDDVTYFNPGRLICARNCGIHVFEKRRGPCIA